MPTSAACDLKSKRETLHSTRNPEPEMTMSRRPHKKASNCRCRFDGVSFLAVGGSGNLKVFELGTCGFSAPGSGFRFISM